MINPEPQNDMPMFSDIRQGQPEPKNSAHQCEYQQGKGVPCYICNPHLKPQNEIDKLRKMQIDNHKLPVNRIVKPQNESRELKPCPFCGQSDVFENRDIENSYIWCGSQVFCGGTASTKSWQNAWAHKRIAELQEIQGINFLRIAELEAKVAKLESLAEDRRQANVLKSLRIEDKDRRLDKQGRINKQLIHYVKHFETCIWPEGCNCGLEALKSAEELNK